MTAALILAVLRLAVRRPWRHRPEPVRDWRHAAAQHRMAARLAAWDVHDQMTAERTGALIESVHRRLYARRRELVPS